MKNVISMNYDSSTKLKTMEISEAWPDTFDEGYIIYNIYTYIYIYIYIYI